MSCHFCKSKTDLYASYYKNDRTEGKWVRAQNIHSCTNPKCPYKRNFKDGEITEYPSEMVMVQKLDPYWELADKPTSLPLDTANPVVL